QGAARRRGRHALLPGDRTRRHRPAPQAGRGRRHLHRLAPLPRPGPLTTALPRTRSVVRDPGERLDLALQNGTGGESGLPSGQMASSTAATAALLAPRRHLSDRQARTVAGLLDATVDELREVGFDGLTVRNVARRAGVAPATAYNYFA